MKDAGQYEKESTEKLIYMAQLETARANDKECASKAARLWELVFSRTGNDRHRQLVRKYRLRAVGIIDLNSLNLGVWDESGVKRSDAVKPKHEGVPKGKKHGLDVCATWIHFFQSNEKRKKKWSDNQISLLMHREFPGYENEAFNRVSDVRKRYNAGGMTQGLVPEIQSKEYTKT